MSTMTAMTVEDAIANGYIDKPQQRVVVLQGPRGVGKDYIADMVTKYNASATHMKFSAIMKSVVSLGTGVDEDVLEGIKLEKVFGAKGSQSYVDLQIAFWQWLSEQFGDEVLGRFAMSQITISTYTRLAENPHSTLHAFVFSDGGRKSEVEWVADKVGRDNMLLVQLDREGHTFEGDIRSYFTIDGVTCHRYTNAGTVKSAKVIVANIHEWLLRSYGSASHVDAHEMDRMVAEHRMSILKDTE